MGLLREEEQSAVVWVLYTLVRGGGDELESFAAGISLTDEGENS